MGCTLCFLGPAIWNNLPEYLGDSSLSLGVLSVIRRHSFSLVVNSWDAAAQWGLCDCCALEVAYLNYVTLFISLCSWYLTKTLTAYGKFDSICFLRCSLFIWISYTTVRVKQNLNVVVQVAPKILCNISQKPKGIKCWPLTIQNRINSVRRNHQCTIMAFSNASGFFFSIFFTLCAHSLGCLIDFTELFKCWQTASEMT